MSAERDTASEGHPVAPWRAGLGWFLAITPLVIWQIASWAGHTIDDAGITFAYIDTWLEGGGLAFRPGEPPVEAYTNALWLFLLTPFAAIGLDLELVSKVLGVAAGLGAAWGIHRLALGVVGARAWTALLGPLVVWGAPLFGFWVLSGLENGLFALLLVAMIARAVADRARWWGRRDDGPRFGWRAAWPSAAIACAVVMTRPDGILYVTFAQLWLLRAAWKGPDAAARDASPSPPVPRAARLRTWLIQAALAAGLYLTYFAARFAYFQQLLPNSFAAKSPAQQGGVKLFDLEAPGWSYVLGGLEAYAVAIPLAVAVVLALSCPRTRRLASLVTGCLGAGLLFPVVAGGDWMFEWRLLSFSWPLVGLLLALGVIAVSDHLTRLVGRLPERLSDRARARARALVGPAVAALLIALAFVHFRGPWLARADAREEKVNITVSDLAHRSDFFQYAAELAGLAVPRVADVDAGGMTWKRKVGFLDLGKLGDLHLARYDRETWGHLRDYVYYEDAPDLIHLHGAWYGYKLHEMDEWRTRYAPILPIHTRRYRHVFADNVVAVAPFTALGPDPVVPEARDWDTDNPRAGGRRVAGAGIELAVVAGDLYHGVDQGQEPLTWELVGHGRGRLPAELEIIACADVEETRQVGARRAAAEAERDGEDVGALAPEPDSEDVGALDRRAGDSAGEEAPRVVTGEVGEEAEPRAVPADRAPVDPDQGEQGEGDGGGVPAGDDSDPGDVAADADEVEAPGEVGADAAGVEDGAVEDGAMPPSRPRAARRLAARGRADGPKTSATDPARAAVQVSVSWVGGLFEPRPVAARRWVTGVASTPVAPELLEAPCLALVHRHRGRDEVIAVTLRTDARRPLASAVIDDYLERLAADPAALLRSGWSPIGPHRARTLCAALGHFDVGACHAWLRDGVEVAILRGQLEAVAVARAEARLAEAATASGRDAIDALMGAGWWLVALREATGRLPVTDLGDAWRELSEEVAGRLREVSERAVDPLSDEGMRLLELAIRVDPSSNRARIEMEARRPRAASRVRGIEGALREQLLEALTGGEAVDEAARARDAAAWLASAAREGEVLEAWRCLAQGPCGELRDAPEVAPWAAWVDGVLGLGPSAPRPPMRREVWGFEGGSLHGFQLVGEAFGSGPATKAQPGQHEPSGYEQMAFLNGFHGGDASMGRAESRPFVVEDDFLGILVAGGLAQNGVRIELAIGDEVVLTAASPRRSPTLDPLVWDLRPWRGQVATLRFVDEGQGSWGHLVVDAVTWLR